MERNLQTLALINTISRGEFHLGTVSITFLDRDLEVVKLPHSNPLVIKLRITNAMVSRVLVDRESSLDPLLGSFLKDGN